MVEMLLIVFLLAVGLTTLILAMNYWLGFTQQTRQKIIAVNLARESMEAIYNIRDTNWNLWAGQKEFCRLNRNPFESLGNDHVCAGDSRFDSGYYVLESFQEGGQMWFVLSGGNLPEIDLADWISTQESVYALCQSGQLWTSCPYSEVSSQEGVYLRQIAWLGLYDKESNNLISCSHGNQYPICGTGTAKEFRFCSRVYYAGESRGVIELCGLMTNFAE